MRVLICGGRDYDSPDAHNEIAQAISKLPLDTIIITGMAKGADRIASQTAHDMGYPEVLFPANWEGEGRAAGVLRNQRMLEIGQPDEVWAFPGGVGTRDMVSRAFKNGIKVKRPAKNLADNTTVMVLSWSA